ncbi:MAG: IS6 family transposase [Herminiimonas sp.]|nr:IS6 family transposase [Herminiimonas sp.]
MSGKWQAIKSQSTASFVNKSSIRRKQPQRGDKCFLDEVVLTIKGQHHYLWRAVDEDGFTLDILMQSRRNRHAAKRFFRKLMNHLRYAPRVIITDKMKSYAAAKREILPSIEYRQHKRLNNQCEASHQPTRQQEKQMRRFKSARHAQRFLSAHFPINNLFRVRRFHPTASAYREARQYAFSTWPEASCAHGFNNV